MIPVHLAQCLNRLLNVKALVAIFIKDKALEGAFSVIVKLQTSRMFVSSSACLTRSEPSIVPVYASVL